MEWSDPSLARQEHRVEVLRRRYEALRHRIQRSDGSHELERLDNSLDRRTRRLEHIDGELARLQLERQRLEREIGGCLTGLEALLTDLVSRFESIDGHDWTPIPIVGFLAWTERDGLMHDGSQAWRGRSAVGGCGGAREGDPPHPTRGCAARGCGISALRRLHDLDEPGGLGLRAVGRLALSGRIVEHEHGFRAQLAEVEGIVATDGARWLRTRETDTIGSFFSDPVDAFARLSAPLPPEMIPLIEADIYLADPASPRRTDPPSAPIGTLGEILRCVVVEPIGAADDET